MDLTQKSLKAVFSHFTLVAPGRRCMGAASPFERALETTPAEPVSRLKPTESERVPCVEIFALPRAPAV